MLEQELTTAQLPALLASLMVDEVYEEEVIGLYEFMAPRLTFFPASYSRHQIWAGGLEDHLTQMLLLIEDSNVPSDALPWEVCTAVLLHDYEKLWKYQVREDHGDPEIFTPFVYRKDWSTPNELIEFSIGSAMAAFKLPFSIKVLNAIAMSEGGWSRASQDREADMLPLACVLNAADIASAKVFKEVRGQGAARRQGMSRHQLFSHEQMLNNEYPEESYRWPSSLKAVTSASM